MLAARGLLCAVAVGLLMSGCGGSELESRKKPAQPPRVMAPNVVGKKAEIAVHDLERAQLVVSMVPEPEDRSLCTVKRQSRIGRVRKGTEVRLVLRCDVVVPDVAGEPTGRAVEKIEGAGNVTVAFDGGEPRDAGSCTVTQQDEVGQVDSGTEVLLDFICPLTREDVKEAGEALARQSPEPGEEFTIVACDLVGDDEGRCDVTYLAPDGFECRGEIIVTLINEGESTNARHDIDCF